MSIGTPPFEITLVQSRSPSSPSLNPISFFSSYRHRVTKNPALRNASRVTNQVQWPPMATTSPMIAAAQVPDSLRIFRIRLITIRIMTSATEISRFVWLNPPTISRFIPIRRPFEMENAVQCFDCEPQKSSTSLELVSSRNRSQFRLVIVHFRPIRCRTNTV